MIPWEDARPQEIESADMNLCDRIVDIRSLPPKQGAEAEDEKYLQIKSNLDRLVSCLVDRISDTTPMATPISSPAKVDGFVVGDLAFFLLVDFGVVPFEDMLPMHVRVELKQRGIFAYYDWVAQGSNRDVLRENCVRWVSSEKRLRSAGEGVDRH